MQPLQIFETIYPHAAVLLAPTIIRLFRNLDLANSVYTRLTCPTSASNSRSFVTVSYGLCYLIAISDSQFPVIKQGLIQWGKFSGPIFIDMHFFEKWWLPYWDKLEFKTEKKIRIIGICHRHLITFIDKAFICSFDELGAAIPLLNIVSNLP